MDHSIAMSSQADPLSPAPWQVSETISDSPSEPNSHPDSPNVSDYRETLSGRWGINLFYGSTKWEHELTYESI